MNLLNPARNELGRISEFILDEINKPIKANQWKNTCEDIK